MKYFVRFGLLNVAEPSKIPFCFASEKVLFVLNLSDSVSFLVTPKVAVKRLKSPPITVASVLLYPKDALKVVFSSPADTEKLVFCTVAFLFFNNSPQLWLTPSQSCKPAASAFNPALVPNNQVSAPALSKLFAVP